MKSRDEDSTTPTTAKAVDNIKEKEETLLTKPLTKEQSKRKKKKY